MHVHTDTLQLSIYLQPDTRTQNDKRCTPQCRIYYSVESAWKLRYNIVHL